MTTSTAPAPRTAPLALRRLAPTKGDAAAVVLGCLAPFMAGAVPDASSALDLAALLKPMIIAAAGAAGGLIGKTFTVAVWSFIRAKAYAMLSDNDPSNDTAARALLMTADRLDADGRQDAPLMPAQPILAAPRSMDEAIREALKLPEDTRNGKG